MTSIEIKFLILMHLPCFNTTGFSLQCPSISCTLLNPVIITEDLKKTSLQRGPFVPLWYEHSSAQVSPTL